DEEPSMKRAPSPWSYPMLLRGLRAAAIAAAAAVAPVAAGVALAAQEGTTSDATLPDAGPSETGVAAPVVPAASGAAGAPAAASEPLAKRCASPEEIAPDQERIEGIASAVGQGEQPLSVVVLGSLSGQDVASRGPAAF